MLLFPTNKIGKLFFVSHIGVVVKLGKKKTYTIWANEKNDIEPFKIVDTDDDGVIDELDKDPNTPIGVQVYGNGTPVDSDADGVPDYLDKCKFEKGRIDNDGCPFIGDKDRDGIPDRDDKCPEVKGLEKYEGCPDENSLRITELVTIMSYSKNIYFDTASNSIRNGFYYTMLDDVAEIMLKNKDVTFSVSGYTDDVGTVEYNLKLSAIVNENTFEDFIKMEGNIIVNMLQKYDKKIDILLKSYRYVSYSICNQ